MKRYFDLNTQRYLSQVCPVSTSVLYKYTISERIIQKIFCSMKPIFLIHFRSIMYMLLLSLSRLISIACKCIDFSLISLEFASRYVVSVPEKFPWFLEFLLHHEICKLSMPEWYFPYPLPKCKTINRNVAD